jgi:threonine dehydratase
MNFDHQTFRAEVECAQTRIQSYVRKTPCLQLSSQELAQNFGITHEFDVWLKLEQLQHSGSFKARGMFNRMLSCDVPEVGVTIASGGNAGIATAYAAKVLGHKAEIFVPEVSSAAKRAKLKALGATVHVRGKAYADAAAACVEHQAQSGALQMHAYDQPEVLQGAGTLAREIEQQIGTPDSILVSVGGGGLIAGIAGWFANQARVIALESEGTPTLYKAREAGEPVDVAVSGIAADALGAKRIGSLAWPITQSAVKLSLLLTDESIRAAQLALWDKLRIAVEPAAALPLAALMTGAYVPKQGEKVCLVVCGANVDVATLASA